MEIQEYKTEDKNVFMRLYCCDGILDIRTIMVGKSISYPIHANLKGIGRKALALANRLKKKRKNE